MYLIVQRKGDYSLCKRNVSHVRMKVHKSVGNLENEHMQSGKICVKDLAVVHLTWQKATI